MDNNTNNTQNQQEESVQLMDLLYKCLSKWYWFVISAALCLALAVFYVLKTPPVYTRSEEIQIKTNSRGQSISTDAEISQLGLFNTNTNVYNEIKAFGAKSLMSEVVKRLNLDMNYITDGRFHDNVLYGLSTWMSRRMAVSRCPISRSGTNLSKRAPRSPAYSPIPWPLRWVMSSLHLRSTTWPVTILRSM